MQVEEIMTRDVTTVAPHVPLKEVARTMIERGISGLPVVDLEDRLVGVVSETDIVYRARADEPRRPTLVSQLLHRGRQDMESKLGALTAGEAMTSPAVTVEPTVSVPRAAALMTDRGLSRLVVTDGRDGQLVGIVTRSDFVRAFARSDSEIESEVGRRLGDSWVPTTVSFTVADGIVKLSGAIETREQANGLIAIVRGVPGVVSVVSDLRTSELTGASRR